MASREGDHCGIGEEQPDAPGRWGVRTDSGGRTWRGRNKGVGALCSAPRVPPPPVSWVLSGGNAAAPPHRLPPGGLPAPSMPHRHPHFSYSWRGS